MSTQQVEACGVDTRIQIPWRTLDGSPSAIAEVGEGSDGQAAFRQDKNWSDRRLNERRIQSAARQRRKASCRGVQSAARLIEEVRGDDPELASYLGIEERELAVGGLR
jgi:hypothetical protein